MKKLPLKFKSFAGIANKVGRYVNAICSLPPQGEGAKAQVAEEVRQLFKELNGQSKSLENAILGAIYGRDEK